MMNKMIKGQTAGTTKQCDPPKQNVDSCVPEGYPVPHVALVMLLWLQYW